jgi:hypothetical protein
MRQCHTHGHEIWSPPKSKNPNQVMIYTLEMIQLVNRCFSQNLGLGKHKLEKGNYLPCSIDMPRNLRYKSKNRGITCLRMKMKREKMYHRGQRRWAATSCRARRDQRDCARHTPQPRRRRRAPLTHVHPTSCGARSSLGRYGGHACAPRRCCRG